MEEENLELDTIDSLQPYPEGARWRGIESEAYTATIASVFFGTNK